MDRVYPLNPHQIVARTRARRVRRVASLTLALVLIVAGTRYVLQTRAAGPTVEDLMPGSEAARARAASILIGSFGESLVEGWRFMQEPAPQALLLVAAAIAGTLFSFRVATLIERYAGEDDKPL
jgi:peptidoglycan/LPS O-acetylase OafA/YrhL